MITTTTKQTSTECDDRIVTDLSQLIESKQRFPVIYADPPWQYRNRASRGAAAKHYPTMSLEAICAEQVNQIAADDAVLFLWTTVGMLFDAFKVIESWGFVFIDQIVWCKPQMGCGNYWRISHEHLFIAIRGNPQYESDALQTFVADRKRHSEKPEQARQMIEAASDGPYLELYSRKAPTSSEWTVYGNQVNQQSLPLRPTRRNDQMTTTALTQTATKTNSIATDKIRTDGGTQARSEIDYDVVQSYADEMQEGATFPPLVVFFDGTSYWLADGFHRLYAYRRLDILDVHCDVRSGSVNDAILHAAGANATHGMRRTNADKRRAVEMLLSVDEWVSKSNRWIAEKCGVSDPFVMGIRNELLTVSSCDERTGIDGKARKLPTSPPKPKTSSVAVEDDEPDDGGASEDFEPIDLKADLPPKKPAKRETRDLSELATVAGSISAQMQFLLQDLPATKGLSQNW